MSAVRTREICSGPSPFSILPDGAALRRVVGDCRGHDHDVSLGGMALHDGVHLLGAAHAHELGAGWRRQRRGTRHQDHPRPAAHRLGRDRIAHLAARPVADVPHVIQVFVGRSRGDDDEPSEERARRLQDAFGRFDDLVGLGEPPLPDPPAGEVAGARVDEAHAPRRQRREVGADRVVFQHVGVHRRRDQHRRAGGEVQRAQEVVGDAVRELADDVRGRGRDQQQPDVGRERDVLDVGVGARRPLGGDDAAAW